MCRIAMAGRAYKGRLAWFWVLLSAAIWDLWGPSCRAHLVIQDKACLSFGSVLAQARGKRVIAGLPQQGRRLGAQGTNLHAPGPHLTLLSSGKSTLVALLLFSHTPNTGGCLAH